MLTTMVTADEERPARFPWRVLHLLIQGVGVVAMRAVAFSKVCECHCKTPISCQYISRVLQDGKFIAGQVHTGTPLLLAMVMC